MKITHNELVKRCIQKGYALRANINPGFMRAISDWAKDKGIDVAKTIRAGMAKEAVSKLVAAQGLKRSMRDEAKKFDQLVYNESGIAIAWYETATQILYRLEVSAE